MEFADQSEDEQMSEEVELISKRPQRATTAADPASSSPHTGRSSNSGSSKISVTPSSNIGGLSGKWPIGVALLIICVIAMSTGFGRRMVQSRGIAHLRSPVRFAEPGFRAISVR